MVISAIIPASEKPSRPDRRTLWQGQGNSGLHPRNGPELLLRIRRRPACTHGELAHERIVALLTEIHHVAIRSQPDVVGEVPAWIVGIIVQDDVVVVPLPVSAIIVVVRRNLKEEAAKLEALAVSAVKAPNVTRADGLREAAVFPRVVGMIVGVMSLMSHPLVIFRVYVGSFRVAFLIAKAAPTLVLLGSALASAVRLAAAGFRAPRLRTVCGNVAVADAVVAVLLRRAAPLRATLLFATTLLAAAFLRVNSGD